MIKSLLLPPGSLLLVLLAAWLLRKRRAKLAAWLFGLGLGSFYLLSTPFCSGLLRRSLESAPAFSLAAFEEAPPELRAQAICVFGADFQVQAPEYEHVVFSAADLELSTDGGAQLSTEGPAQTVGDLSLVRLRYAAELQRQTGLPICVSGGRLRRAETSLAELMRRALVRDFGAQVRWLEDRSQTTWQNAQMSADMLRADQVERVLLVTHAWHMPRAQGALQRQGLQVTPAPTEWRPAALWSWREWLPQAASVQESQWALHEWLGRLWYMTKS